MAVKHVSKHGLVRQWRTALARHPTFESDRTIISSVLATFYSIRFSRQPSKMVRSLCVSTAH
jgi:hypothetical protein